MGENRNHPPSPVKQRNLWSSPFKDMERIEPPVRSFKSFIQTVPPNPSAMSEKPLPPTPLTSSCQSLSPLFLSIPESILSIDSWKASSELEGNHPPCQPFPASSVSSARNYPPAIPESSPRLCNMQTEPDLRSFGSNAFEPLEEMSDSRPTTPPPRHPSRRSLLHMPSTQSDLDRSMSLMDRPHPLSISSSRAVTPMPFLEPDLRPRLHATTSPLLMDYQTSDTPGKAKPHAPLGTRSPQLNAVNLRALSKDHEILPQHLPWYLSSDEQSVDESSSDTSSNVLPVSEDQRPLKIRGSWDYVRHLYQSRKSQFTNDDTSRPADDPAARQRKHILKSNADAFSSRDCLIPRTMAHTKCHKHNKERASAVDMTDVNRSSVPSSDLASTSQSMKHHQLFIQLPRGFALVRSLPSTISRSDASDIYDVSPRDEISPEDPTVESPITASGRHSSWNSQRSQKMAASAMAVSQRLRDSFRSLPSLHPRSTASSPPTPPLAHEMPFPKTPPPLPRYSPRALKFDPVSWARTKDEKPRPGVELSRTESDEGFTGCGFRSKARGVRGAWRKRQKELKHDKLKQSITVLGPTDPTVTTGYIKRHGGRTGERGTKSGRMPGYMVA